MLEKTVNGVKEKNDVSANSEKYVKPIFVSGQNSATVILPKKLVKEHGLESGSHVVIESTDKGIFIRKIQLEEL